MSLLNLGVPSGGSHDRRLHTEVHRRASREGYDLARLRADAIAGLTVAIVALPLSMAIAIASGVTPDRGLYTAIIGGFLVLVARRQQTRSAAPPGPSLSWCPPPSLSTASKAWILATMMSGVFLMLAGALKLGDYVKFIPYPVTVGFTAGIAVIIFASQISELLGLTLPVSRNRGPAPWTSCRRLPPQCPARPWRSIDRGADHRHDPRIAASAPHLARHADRRLPRLRRDRLPASRHRHEIGSRFGGHSPQSPAATSRPVARPAQAVLPDAIAFALLGAIESLLSAVVADGMTGRRHRSNVERSDRASPISAPACSAASA